jgi:peptide/nickel transport system substrate-binding protein
MTQKPFTDIRVRQAFMYAIDRKEVAATIGGSIGSPVYSETQAPQEGSLSREQLAARSRKDGRDYVYEVDRAKAKKLLAAAGYPDGLTVEFYQTERGEYMVPMQNIQAQLRLAGINAKFIMIDHPTWHHHIRADMTPLVLYNCIRPNSDVRLTHFHHSSSEVVKGSNPVTNFSHLGRVDADGDGKIDSVDDLIEKARDELDPAKQAALWSEASVKLLGWATSFPVFVKRWTFARRNVVDWGYPLDTVIHNSPIYNEVVSKND